MEATGTNFLIRPGEAYWIAMRISQSGVELNDPNLCIISQPPVIFDFNPKSGPVGESVLVTGNHFSPEVSLEPRISMEKVGGGAVEGTIAQFDNMELLFTVPDSAASGPLTVTVHGV